MKQLLNMKHEKTLDTMTIRKILGRVVTLLTHAERNDFIDKNPAIGLLPKKGKRLKDARAIYTSDDLAKMFHSPPYAEDTHKHTYRFWMPLLGLFTGARLNELAQLHVDDVREVGGVWCLDINDDAPDKKLKNVSSQRIIPLHPFLLERLHFVDGLVAERRSRGHKRVFSELHPHRDGYGAYVSKWFNNEFRRQCGVMQEKGGGKKDFHSFRTTFSTHLSRDKGVNDRMLEQVLGHASPKSTTFTTYVDDFTPKQVLEECINLIDYGVDLGHLERSRYVMK